KGWRGGKPGRPAVRPGDRVYLTWCLRDGKRVVFLVADDDSLEAVKKEQQARVAAEVAREGIAGQVEGVEGTTVQFMVFPTYWSQAGVLRPGRAVRLTATGKGHRPAGPTVTAKVVSQKNRGSYGSGVNDVVLELARKEDARQVTAWAEGPVVR